MNSTHGCPQGLHEQVIRLFYDETLAMGKKYGGKEPDFLIHLPFNLIKNRLPFAKQAILGPLKKSKYFYLVCYTSNRREKNKKKIENKNGPSTKATRKCFFGLIFFC